MAKRGSEEYKERKVRQQQEYLERRNAKRLNLLERATEITDTSKDQRIYVVVANTVQNSIGLDVADGRGPVPGWPAPDSGECGIPTPRRGRLCHANRSTLHQPSPLCGRADGLH